jgi:uncharacterized MAPEG superfamily protein
MDGFAEYGHALVALAVTAVFQLVLGPLAAMRKTRAGLAPGAEPPADYGDAAYRWHRAYGNLSESMGPFVAVTVAAVLAGAPAVWVNLFAALFLLLRVVLAAVHVAGIGKPDMSVRSVVYVGGWLMCLCLAFLAIKTVIIGG